MEYKISKHCIDQIKIRGKSKEIVKEIMKKPDMVIKQDEDISVYQSLSFDKKYLYRIFVNTTKNPKLIVTAYKTSKKDKYYENKIRQGK